MAKRIKIDFTKTEERSGWNTRQIPEGLYPAKVVSVQQTEAQDGTTMLVYGFAPEDKRFRSRLFPYYCKLQQNQLWKLRDLMVAAGETVPKKAVQIDPDKIIGRVVAIEVEDDAYNGTVRSSVNGVYGKDILEEDGNDSAPEDDDLEDDDLEEEVEEEEEYEEDESEDEEEDDSDEEEDEEEYDEDEEELDEDEEEELFEDDDEDYEDDEEEEEEPEPAPKRRAPAKKAPAKAPAKAAAKAPAKKAPAKAAAPARRVVKRRA